MPTRLLLVNPTHGDSFWGLNYALDLLRTAKYSTAPLGIATVAALTPDDWEIRLADENVEPIDLDHPCDIVGITAMNVQARRAYELASEFRRRGRLVVMGGPFATLQPERCADHVDVLVVGEAERTWPRFCADYEAGDLKPRYVEDGVVDITESPIPRYDLLRMDRYSAVPVQTTRGCPFACEFCDIIVMQGRKVRAKTTAQVIAEIDAIRAFRSPSIFFADDNFVGNLKHAEKLCNAIEAYRRQTGYQPLFFTQASLNMAERPELLRALVRAGFTRVFLGIETPRQASLREAGKRQNGHGTLVERIHTIQRAGLMIWAGMIVGFDHDDESIFEEQASFLDDAGIPVAMLGMLNAPPRTPLYARLQRANRIDPDADWEDNCAWTNIVPKQMTRPRLFRGFADLVTEVYRQENYARRVLANVYRMGPAEARSTASRFPSTTDFGDFFRAVKTFTCTTDPVRRRHFLPNLFRVFRNSPSRAVEAAIHLGLWRHFEHYSPLLSAQLRDTAAREERLGEPSTSSKPMLHPWSAPRRADWGQF